MPDDGQHARDRALLAAAVSMGAPPLLAREAVATVRLDRDDDGTHSVDHPIGDAEFLEGHDDDTTEEDT